MEIPENTQKQCNDEKQTLKQKKNVNVECQNAVIFEFAQQEEHMCAITVYVSQLSLCLGYMRVHVVVLM